MLVVSARTVGKAYLRASSLSKNPNLKLMNKLYTSALAVCLIAGTASAQSGQQVPNFLKDRAAAQSTRTQMPVRSADRDVIWSSDFSNASDWNIGNINDPNNDNWVIGTTPPSGSFAINPIASTTAANGFALFDSDLLCGGTQNAWIGPANSYDLSAYPNVVLQFEQYYREFQGDCYVETSTDGTTWSSTQINDIGGNASTANPQLYSINLSSGIGGASTAWFRFRYQGGCDYAWMIDDVELSTLPDHELIMDYGYTVQFSEGYEYGRVPQSQMGSTLNVGASVINFGVLAQANVVVTATVEDEGGATIATATSNIPSMLNGDTVVTDEVVTLPSPLPVGRYTVHFSLSSDDIGTDANLDNNTAIRYFSVTDDLYSIDAIDVVPDSILTLSTLGTASFTDNTQDVRLLNYYEVHAQETFHGVEVYLSTNNTDPGSYFIAAVYDTVDVWANNLASPLVESEIRVITADDISNGIVSVHFMDPITLAPNAYFVGVRLYQEGGNDIYILDDTTVPQPFGATMLWIPVDDQNQNLYSNGNAMAIRLSSNPSVGVQESTNLEGVTMYPSPTAGPVEIRLESPGKMNVEVYNVLGELVKTASFSGTATTLDLTGHSAGIYTIRVSDGAHYNVQRITLK